MAVILQERGGGYEWKGGGITGGKISDLKFQKGRFQI
jgi:hypothetical protein